MPPFGISSKQVSVIPDTRLFSCCMASKLFSSLLTICPKSVRLLVASVLVEGATVVLSSRRT